MKKPSLRIATVLITAVCIGGACTREDIEFLSALPLLVVPAEVPELVERVLADPDAFSDADHPLIGTTPGTILDDLDTLEGCWAGFFSSESPGADQLDYPPGTYGVSVLVFDTREKRVTEHTYYSEFALPTGEPVVLTLHGTYRKQGNRRIEITYTFAEAGVVRPDGSLERHSTVDLMALASLHEPLLFMITVQGEFMNRYFATEEQGFGDLEADDILPWTSFHTRLDCRPPDATTP